MTVKNLQVQVDESDISEVTILVKREKNGME